MSAPLPRTRLKAVRVSPAWVKLDEGADALLGLAQADDVDEFGRSNSLRGNGMMGEVTKK